MWNLIKKDYKLLFSNKMEVILFIISVPFLLSLNSFDEKWVFLLIVVSVYFMSIGLFDNQGIDVLVYSLPIKKYKTVIYRYIIFFINHLIITAYIFIVVFILEKLNIVDKSNYINLNFFKFTLSFSMIVISIAIPFIFILKFETSRRVINVIIVLFINLSSNLFREGSIYDPAIDRVRLVNTSWFIIGVGVLMISSIIISMYSYKEKEF